VLPFGPSFDVVGWFARDIALFEKIGDVLLGEDTARSPTRLMFAEDAWSEVERPVADALKPAADKVKAVIGPAKQARVSPDGLSAWFETFRTLQGAEIWATLGAWVTETKPKFGPGIKERFEYAATITPERVAAANAKRCAITAHVESLLGADGVICLPTSPRAAPLRARPPIRSRSSIAIRRSGFFASRGSPGFRRSACRWRRSTDCRSGCRCSARATRIAR